MFLDFIFWKDSHVEGLLEHVLLYASSAPVELCGVQLSPYFLWFKF